MPQSVQNWSPTNFVPEPDIDYTTRYDHNVHLGSFQEECNFCIIAFIYIFILYIYEYYGYLL